MDRPTNEQFGLEFSKPGNRFLGKQGTN